MERGLFNSSPLAELPIISPAWTRHTTEALTSIAAIALREGKQRGSGTAQLITHRSRARDLEHLLFEENLHRSIERGEFALITTIAPESSCCGMSAPLCVPGTRKPQRAIR